MSLPAGVVPVLLSAVGFASLPLWAKLGYRAGLDPVTLLAVRFALAAPLILGAGVLRSPAALRRPPRDLFLLLSQGAVGYGLPAVLALSAFRIASGAVVSALYFTFPIWVTLGAVLVLREPLRGRQAAALALGVGGAVVVAVAPGAAGPDAAAAVKTPPAGIALSLGAALAYAVYTVSAQRFLARLDPLAVAGYSMLGCALVFLAVRLVAGGPWPGAAGPLLGLGGAMAVTSTALPLVLLLSGLRRLGAARTAVLATIEPVVTALLLFLALGERLSPWQAVGILAIVVGVALVAGPRDRPRAPGPAYS